LNPHELANLLSDVALGRCSVEQALSKLPLLHDGRVVSEANGHRDAAVAERVTLDLDRQRRCGFPEVIYGAGKPTAMILDIVARQQAAGQPSFATRVDDETAVEIEKQFPTARANRVARTVAVPLQTAALPCPIRIADPVEHQTEVDRGAAAFPPHVAVVTAGSTDAPVAEEAIETLHWMGIPFQAFDDIGVAGPQRLLAAVPKLRLATAVIVIAGMEGALPAAVGGHLSVPVFAVPTSVGYGATLGGLTAMLGMLSSCASNVAVVNIDAGFKAAYLSGLVVKQLG
jgi:NCAIR mutase (PurE)-related protein